MIKYLKDRTEAVKVLFAEILETNEKLEQSGSEREITFELDGGKFPAVTVRFWNWNEERNPRKSFEILLDDYRVYNRQRNLKACAEKVAEWREKYGNPEEGNG